MESIKETLVAEAAAATAAAAEACAPFKAILWYSITDHLPVDVEYSGKSASIKFVPVHTSAKRCYTDDVPARVVDVTEGILPDRLPIWQPDAELLIRGEFGPRNLEAALARAESAALAGHAASALASESVLRSRLGDAKRDLDRNQGNVEYWTKSREARKERADRAEAAFNKESEAVVEHYSNGGEPCPSDEIFTARDELVAARRDLAAAEAELAKSKKNADACQERIATLTCLADEIAAGIPIRERPIHAMIVAAWRFAIASALAAFACELEEARAGGENDLAHFLTVRGALASPGSQIPTSDKQRRAFMKWMTVLGPESLAPAAAPEPAAAAAEPAAAAAEPAAAADGLAELEGRVAALRDELAALEEPTAERLADIERRVEAIRAEMSAAAAAKEAGSS